MIMIIVFFYVLIDISLAQSITGGICFFFFFLIFLFGENSCASKGVWQPLRTPPTSSAIPQIIKVSGPHGKQRGGDLWQRRLPWQQAQLSRLPIAEVKHNQLNHITGSWQAADGMEREPAAAQRDNQGEDGSNNLAASDQFQRTHWCILVPLTLINCKVSEVWCCLNCGSSLNLLFSSLKVSSLCLPLCFDLQWH